MKHAYTVRLAIDHELKLAGGETRTCKRNVTLGVVAADLESAVAAAKEHLKEQNPTVWGVQHQAQIDVEAPCPNH